MVEGIPRRLKSWELGDERRLKTGWDGQANIRTEGRGRGEMFGVDAEGGCQIPKGTGRAIEI